MWSQKMVPTFKNCVAEMALVSDLMFVTGVLQSLSILVYFKSTNSIEKENNDI